MGGCGSAATVDRNLPAPEYLAGEWRSDEHGVELTLAPRPRGRLHYATSGCKTAVLRPEGCSYTGKEIFWNCGMPEKVLLQPRGSELEHREWMVSSGDWSTPWVLRRLSVAEAAARSRYDSLAPLWEALAEGHTVLIKGSWLLELRRAAAVLPRRQDLPLVATWEPSELQSAVEAGTVRIVALSYCWKERDHPDPQGEQLRIVAALIRRRLSYTYPDGMNVLEDLAVFWDYPSLFQKPRSGPEQESFNRALASVNLWYAHSSTEAWLLTRAPKGTKSYSERGWPVFERALCGLITPDDFFLDVGCWEGGSEDWAEVALKCQAQREPPMRPEKAVELLKAKTFTHSIDFEKVRSLYERTYRELLGSARCLTFTNLLNWGNSEAEALAEVLPDCTQLEELHLSGDGIGAAGAAALGAAAARCDKLRLVSLSQNPLKDEGVAALLARLVNCPTLEVLLLAETYIRDRGAEAIAAAAPSCRALRRLSLSNCYISDEGAVALGAALGMCSALERLEIRENELTVEGKTALKAAWASAGKQRGGCLV